MVHPSMKGPHLSATELDPRTNNLSLFPCSVDDAGPSRHSEEDINHSGNGKQEAYTRLTFSVRYSVVSILNEKNRVGMTFNIFKFDEFLLK